jgi:hypothetical protein
MGLSEDGERSAADELDNLGPCRAVLARKLPEAEKEEAAAFERAQPGAVAELAKRQGRGNLAREILAERRQEQDQARERERPPSTTGPGDQALGATDDLPVPRRHEGTARTEIELPR